VAHLAGSLGLDVLASHPRRAALHPLVALPSAEVGADRLRGAWFAVAGDALVRDVVTALDGHAIDVRDEDRAAYHAAACIASNHVVASAGLPLDAYLDLVRGTVDNVARLGPAAALTGPVARGDWDTVARHLSAPESAQRPAYEAMADSAHRLARADEGCRGATARRAA